MSNFKKGDRVHVDFVTESSTEFSGQLFKGDGVIDRAEDGYLFGRLDNGSTFMCNDSDAVKLSDEFICLNRVNSLNKCLAARKGTVITEPEYKLCFCGENK